jgi:hypothetical protein
LTTLIHAGRVVTAHVAEHTLTIDLGGDDRTDRRATSRACYGYGAKKSP